MKIVKCAEDAIGELAAAIGGGAVVVIPTDTVYGLAAAPSNPSAVERLYAIKGRERRKPIAMLCDGIESVRRFGAVLPSAAEALAKRFWPGALTLVLPCGDGFEGFRVPDHAWTRRLLSACGGVLRVTSANLSGRRAATDAPAALREVGLEADCVVDDGVSPGGQASTVVKVEADGTLAVLRQGPVSVEGFDGQVRR